MFENLSAFIHLTSKNQAAYYHESWDEFQNTYFKKCQWILKSPQLYLKLILNEKLQSLEIFL